MSATLATQATGRGEPVVLIHGWALNLAVWDATASALASTYRCIGVDLPGHGRSGWTAPDARFAHQLARLEQALPPGPCRVIGWSLGGLFAIALAARQPQRVRALVLVATLPRFLTTASWPYGLDAAALERFATQLQHNYRQTVSDFLDLQTRGSANAATARAQLVAALRARGDAAPAALSAGLEILRNTDLRSELAEIRCPTLAIAGQYDRISPPAGMRALADAVGPLCTLRTLHRAAHAPFISHSDISATEVRGFFDDH